MGELYGICFITIMLLQKPKKKNLHQDQSWPCIPFFQTFIDSLPISPPPPVPSVLSVHVTPPLTKQNSKENPKTKAYKQKQSKTKQAKTETKTKQ